MFGKIRIKWLIKKLWELIIVLRGNINKRKQEDEKIIKHDIRNDSRNLVLQGTCKKIRGLIYTNNQTILK